MSLCYLWVKARPHQQGGSQLRAALAVVLVEAASRVARVATRFFFAEQSEMRQGGTCVSVQKHLVRHGGEVLRCSGSCRFKRMDCWQRDLREASDAVPVAIRLRTPACATTATHQYSHCKVEMKGACTNTSPVAHILCLGCDNGQSVTESRSPPTCAVSRLDRTKCSIPGCSHWVAALRYGYRQDFWLHVAASVAGLERQLQSLIEPTWLRSGSQIALRGLLNSNVSLRISLQLRECGLCEVRGPVLRVSLDLRSSRARGASGGVCPPAHHFGRLEFVLYTAEAEAQKPQSL